MTAKEITAKIEEIEEQGWQFAADASTWSGGFFWHETQGFCTNQGGSFSWIGEAVDAVVRFQTAMAQIS